MKRSPLWTCGSSVETISRPPPSRLREIEQQAAAVVVEVERADRLRDDGRTRRTSASSCRPAGWRRRAGAWAPAGGSRDRVAAWSTTASPWRRSAAARARPRRSIHGRPCGEDDQEPAVADIGVQLRRIAPDARAVHAVGDRRPRHIWSRSWVSSSREIDHVVELAARSPGSW